MIKKIDLYIIKKFLGTYVFAIALIISIVVVFDVNEKLDALLKAPLKATVFDYYLNFIPYFVSLFSPLFTFISVIFFTSKLADNSEIIATGGTEPLNTISISDSTLQAVKKGMLGYTTNGGSVAVPFRNCVVSAGAKTGTAQIGGAMKNGVFVAFAPYDEPEIAVALVLENADAGAVLASEDDPRITKVGKVIRAARLDELPQLINILKGDMSIVGPRPERKCLADEISKEIPEFCYRLKVRGGLTGYAQIYGKYNTSAYDKLRLDMMYIENYSPLLDIRLIILTLRIIFSKDSTEGIDVAMENQRRADALWHELDEQNEEKEKGSAE